MMPNMVERLRREVRAYEKFVGEDKRGGAAERFSISIQKIELAGGSVLHLPAPGVTAVVGANNVGKSTLLRQAAELLHREPIGEVGGWRLVKEISLSRAGTSADLLAWLNNHAHFFEGPNEQGFVRAQVPPQTNQSATSPDLLSYIWEQGHLDRLGWAYQFLVFAADAFQRMLYSQGTGKRIDFTLPPKHPLHDLEDRPDLFRELDRLSQEIFRRPLTLDWLSGEVKLRIGSISMPTPAIDAVSPEYRQALAELPTLAEQGDGMKSLLGLLLPLVAATYPIVLVDEPEAFLHPPQARALGRALGDLALSRRVQVVLATHDRNLLAGLLEASADVSIVRLDRVGDTTTAYQLKTGDVKDVWTDPALKYSNALDGLFHRAVVIAEADADCRFYSAALEEGIGKSSEVPPSEVQFIPAGGKDGLAKAARALLAVRVRVVVSPDLDVLDDPTKLRFLVEAMGGDWSEVEKDYNAATAEFRQPRDNIKVATVLDTVTAALSPYLDEVYRGEHQERIRIGLRSTESPWRILKRTGERGFGNRVAAARLLDYLDSIGIVALREGELERLAPTVDVRKGPAWLPAALKARAHLNDESQLHVRRLLEAVDVLES